MAEKPGAGGGKGEPRLFVALTRCEPERQDGERWHRGLLVNASDQALEDLQVATDAQLDMTSGPFEIGTTRVGLGRLAPRAAVEVLKPDPPAADLCIELDITATVDGRPRRWSFRVWWDRPRYAPGEATPIPELGADGWVFLDEALGSPSS